MRQAVFVGSQQQAVTERKNASAPMQSGHVVSLTPEWTPTQGVANREVGGDCFKFVSFQTSGRHKVQAGAKHGDNRWSENTWSPGGSVLKKSVVFISTPSHCTVNAEATFSRGLSLMRTNHPDTPASAKGGARVSGKRGRGAWRQKRKKVKTSLCARR